MIIKCPQCGHQGKVDPSRIPPEGAKAKCPKCQNNFMISGAEQPQPAAAASPPASQPASQGEAPSQPSTPGVPPLQTPEPPVPPRLDQPREPGHPEPEAQPAPAAEPGSALGFAGGNPAPAPAQGGGLSLKGPSPEAVAAKDVACTGCLKLFKEEEITFVGDRALCGSCQESFQAKGQTPVAPSARPSYGMPAKKPRMEYGGFWVRVGAYGVDAVILVLIWHFALSPVFMKLASKMMTDTVVPITMSMPQDQTFSDPAQMEEQMEEMLNQMQNSMNQVQSKMIVWVWVVQLVGVLLTAGYFIVLEGGAGQTLGKKALGLRVVTPEGDRIGYLKAFVRHIGKIISGVILCIGFVMAAFDDEKRTLHDRMVDTRVVRE